MHLLVLDSGLQPRNVAPLVRRILSPNHPVETAGGAFSKSPYKVEGAVLLLNFVAGELVNNLIQNSFGA